MQTFIKIILIPSGWFDSDRRREFEPPLFISSVQRFDKLVPLLSTCRIVSRKHHHRPPMRAAPGFMVRTLSSDNATDRHEETAPRVVSGSQDNESRY